MWRICQRGGSFIYPIALVLVVGLAITIERWIYLTSTLKTNQKALNLLQNSLKKFSLELSIILLQKFAENNIFVMSKQLLQKYINDKDSLPEDMQKISNWDVSRVTNMSKLFYGYESFDKNINE